MTLHVEALGDVRRVKTEAFRAPMLRARRAMQSARWELAAKILERVIDDARRRGVCHAEALWALAVCMAGMGSTVRALALLEQSIEQDPTALTPYEARDALRRLGGGPPRRVPTGGPSSGRRRRARSPKGSEA